MRDCILFNPEEGGPLLRWFREDGVWFREASFEQRKMVAWRSLPLEPKRAQHLLLYAPQDEVIRVRSGEYPPVGNACGYQKDGCLFTFLGDKALRNGWLSPSAGFIPCGHFQHESLADLLHDEGSIGLESEGWCRVSPLKDQWAPPHEATESQLWWLLNCKVTS